MKRLASWLALMLLVPAAGQLLGPMVVLDLKTRPARIDAGELAGFDSLPAARRQLIRTALAVAWESPWLPYLAGGADPTSGGFDCSGATYFVMRKAGLSPPRSSGGQMEWLRANDRLHVVSDEARHPAHSTFNNLKPGDLLFWAVAGPEAAQRVHHVAMYLGEEKKDGRPVIIGSTDGRAYRGQAANGYGVHDFKVPGPESASKLVGYGTPPGIGIE
jgi:hypothetical protein